MSTWKPAPWVFAISVIFLTGCASAPSGPKAALPRPDGRYDNHAYLVDSSQMDLSRVVSSIVTLVTRTTFLFPDGSRMDKDLVGSGVVVGERFVLTVEHTVSQHGIKIATPFGVLKPQVEKVGEKTYLRHGGSEYLLRALVQDHEDDVALFEIPDGVRPPSFPYRLGNSDDLRVGNYIYVIGNPLNMGVNVREGIVSALRAPREISRVDAKGENAFMVSNGLSPGDSGTPVIAIRDGRFELVGLSQGTFVGSGRLGWVIRINAIRYLLKDAHALPKEKWAMMPASAPAPVPVKTKAGESGGGFPRFWWPVSILP